MGVQSSAAVRRVNGPGDCLTRRVSRAWDVDTKALESWQRFAYLFHYMQADFTRDFNQFPLDSRKDV